MKRGVGVIKLYIHKFSNAEKCDVWFPTRKIINMTFDDNLFLNFYVTKRKKKREKEGASVIKN